MSTPPVPQREIRAERLTRATVESTRQRSELLRSWRRFKRYRPGLFGLVFVAILIVIALLPGVFAPHSPTQGDTSMRGQGPTWSNPLGFDHIGRDQLSRLIYGSRVALTVGLLATLISVVIGVAVGAAAGYFGGWVDTVLSRLVDTVMAFPLFALLVVLAAVLGPSLVTVVVVIGATVWAQYARVVRADVMSIRERDYILAARAVGATSGRIITRHLLPNILGPVIVIASLYVGVIIILESALSFIGLGVQPPTPSWGVMLNDARPFIRTFAHMAIPPGIMITLTVLAFNLIGDGLRDALDPHQSE